MEKCYEFVLQYENARKNLSIKTTCTAAITFGDNGFELKRIAEFLDDMRKIYKEIKKLAKSANFIECELTVAEYDKTNGKSVQASFDRWSYSGHAEEDGVHLNADARYTDATRDMWLDFKKFNPLRDITA